MPQLYNKPAARSIRRQLRQNTSEPENRLWYQLRDRRLQGIKFRRQYGIGPYVVDFYCSKARLAIEIDGDSHYENEPVEQYDEQRSIYIKARNVRIIRFTNLEIMQNIEEVLERILQMVKTPST